ncbi:MAG: hypothetical protein U9Q18_00150, partial [Caldisericota bacterium]|nr:hypothetical protein [Caldisericota bacterium]
MSDIIIDDPRKIYQYKKDDRRPIFNIVTENNLYSEYKLYFESHVKLPQDETNIAYGHYFKAKNNSDKLTIILHGYRHNAKQCMFYFPPQFAKQGISSLILTLPFHGERQKYGKNDGEDFFVLDPTTMLSRFRQIVVDVRTLIDFAGNGSIQNVKEISIFGLSLGGISAVIALGGDKRIKRGIVVLAGGNSA